MPLRHRQSTFAGTLKWFGRRGSGGAQARVQDPVVEGDGKPMYTVTIDETACEGCGECAQLCPYEIISMVKEKAEVTGDTNLCTGCESCVVVCEPGGITIDEF